MATLAIPTDSPLVKGPPQGYWTLAHWEALPDDGNRYEIIEGVLYVANAPGTRHQWVGQMLYEKIGIPARQQGRGYTFLPPYGAMMPGCDPVMPDFAFVSAARASIITEKRIVGVPDVIGEILSDSTRHYDLHIKREAYQKAGVAEYLIVDVTARRVLLHQMDDGSYGAALIFEEGASFALRCLPALTIAVADLFAGLPPHLSDSEAAG